MPYFFMKSIFKEMSVCAWMFTRKCIATPASIMDKTVETLGACPLNKEQQPFFSTSPHPPSPHFIVVNVVVL